VQALTKGEFTEKMDEFEEVLQKFASDIAGGALFEKLPPSELLNKTEEYINRLEDLAMKERLSLSNSKAEEKEGVVHDDG
jgi:hypothetical protein